MTGFSTKTRTFKLFNSTNQNVLKYFDNNDNEKGNLILNNKVAVIRIDNYLFIINLPGRPMVVLHIDNQDIAIEQIERELISVIHPDKATSPSRDQTLSHTFMVYIDALQITTNTIVFNDNILYFYTRYGTKQEGTKLFRITKSESSQVTATPPAGIVSLSGL